MKIQRRQPVVEIPTSSMADVAFLLVVFFMLAMTFAVSRGLDLRLPPDEDEAIVIEPVEAVDVVVLGTGALEVDGRGMRLDQLLAYLRPRLLQDPLKPVILRVADGVAYGPMVETLDELRKGRDVLRLANDIQVAIPTQREVDMFWPGGVFAD